MRLRIVGLAAAFLSACCFSFAKGHFIWLDQKASGDGNARVLVYFAESVGPGEKHLIGKIAHTKSWVRNANGEATEFSLKQPAEGDSPALSANGIADKAACIEAFCDYGVYAHGPGVLVQYYGKHLTGDWTNNANKLATSDKLLLDIVPAIEKDKLLFTVLYRGKPSAEREVVVIDPNEKQHDLTTDPEGRVSLPERVEGRYAVRAGVIEADKSGQRDGKKYAQTWHYCTLTLSIPPSIATKSASTEPKSADPTAVAALVRAREGRAIWENFPGFTADVRLTTSGKQFEGQATIDDVGGVMLKGFDNKEAADWLEEQLASLVQHRMPDGEISEGNVIWADDDRTHPLGRKIKLGESAFNSTYRLRDDVIMEVNRTAGPTMHFTISVLEIERNPDGKYLPRSFTMNFFDNKTGEVKTSLAYLNEWQRVGQFDLPKAIVEVNSHDGKSETRRFEVANCKLLK